MPEVTEREDVIARYRSRTPGSARLWAEAARVLPGGVTHTNRYWAPYPLHIERANGARIIDVDGNEYIDFWVANGTMFMGHAHPAVKKAVADVLERGTHFGLSHPLIVRLAERIVALVPSADLVRFTNSGSEATMHALRIARGYTGRRKIARFEGTFHGVVDGLHYGYRNPFDRPDCAGIPPGAIEDTLILPFNDLAGCEAILRTHAKDLAGVIMEPISGAIPGETAFLAGIRAITRELGAVLIFDEVVTGFRMAPGGAQQLLGVIPDLTLLGKVLGGGFPVGAVCGRREVMAVLDPSRPNEQRVDIFGTYSGNVAVMAAGLATLELLADGRAQIHAAALGAKLAEGIREIGARRGEKLAVGRIGCLVQTYFGIERLPRNHREEHASDLAARRRFHMALMNRGVFFKPGSEGRVSAAHTEADIAATLERIDDVIAKGLHR